MHGSEAKKKFERHIGENLGNPSSGGTLRDFFE